MAKMTMQNALAHYRGKRVFITGHTGFKGSWLAKILLILGAEVRGFALEPLTQPSHFELLGLKDEIDHVVGDICDADHLRVSLTEFQPDIVFHLAAQALVGQSYSDPLETYQTNVVGSASLLEAVRACSSVRSLVYITSDKCYKNLEWEWGYREIDELGGHDPYSASKAAAELVFASYESSFFSKRESIGVASTRAGNVIGGGDWSANRIIPDCVRAIERGEPIELRNPLATRPWQHVLEPLSGYLLLGSVLFEDTGTFQGAWNFGPSTTEIRTVHDVTRAMVKTIGQTEIVVNQDVSQPHEAQLLQLCCDKANIHLNWKPRWSVDKTLEATGDWYRAWLDGQSMAAVTELQIRDYFRELALLEA